MRARTTKISFSVEEDEQLIDHVASYEYIWNTKHEDYKDSRKKVRFWQDIADKLGRKKDECRARWKSIRDHYKRQLKDELGSTGSAIKKRRASYWDKLSFLETTEEERVTSNITIVPGTILSVRQDTEEDTKEDWALSRQTRDVGETSEPAKPSHSGKRKLEDATVEKYLREKNEENKKFNDSIKEILRYNEDDEVDLFFKSIALTVKKFRPQLVCKTKLKVLEIVSEMELQNM